MTLAEVMSELESMGSAQTVKTFRNHGALGDMFGVKVADLKQILKRIKGDQTLAMALWDTNNSDAMYLAALAADGSRMTREQLDHWCKTAWWYMLSEYAVPFVTAEHSDALAIARQWIDSPQTNICTSGWASYTATLSVRPDSELDLHQIDELLDRAVQTIDQSDNRVRYTMNGFVIGVGCYVAARLTQAKAAATQIGHVSIQAATRGCRVPDALAAIAKVESMQRVGKKRKTAK